MKKKSFSRILSLMLAVLLCVQMVPMNAYGAETSSKYELQMATNANANEESELPELEVSGAPEGVVLNYRDMPSIDTSFDETTINPVKGSLPASYSSASNIPSSMSVSQKGDYITSVKNQGSTGTCWAHSAINAAESSYIKANGLSGTASGIDWNEYHLTYYFWNTPQDPLGLWGGDAVYNVSGDDDLMVGGNSSFTFHAYANWIGASADTSFDQYDVLSGIGYGNTDFAFNTAAHMENGYILTMPSAQYGVSQTNMDVVKQMIMNYGSVDIAYCAAHEYYPEYWKDNMYQYCDTRYRTNHAVSIVGWNDNIPATAFATTAPGNGAWLVKNSWGTGWGQGGYFWLSYYDQTISGNAFAYDFMSADTYDNNYQYDGGVCPLTGYSDNYSITGANVFVADSNETIEAIGIYTLDSNTSYEISIYTALGASSGPQDGTLATIQSGTLTYAGFHTIDLADAVNVGAGERYSVIVKETNPNGYAYMAVDTTFEGGWIDSYSYAKAGQSYLYSSYYGWYDLNSDNTYSTYGDNLRIKAFTNERAAEYPSTSDVTVSYRTHVQNYGWQNYVQNGQMAGTSGQALRLEGININVSGNSNLGIAYTTHVQNLGWLPNAYDNEMSGTSGQALRLEAIMIKLTGSEAANYDVYYRVHAQNVGWMGWAKNGAPAGTAGYAYRLEGIQIVVVNKGESFNYNMGGISSAVDYAYITSTGDMPTMEDENAPNVNYQTHVQNIGWQDYKKNGQMSGTSGMCYRLEGIKINLSNTPYTGDIRYTTHVQNIGWQGDRYNSDTWSKNGEMAGTEGCAYRLEGIQIVLTGEMAQHYDVYYRVHVQNYGWMNWVKNGEMAGTEGQALRLEGIEIKLVEK